MRVSGGSRRNSFGSKSKIEAFSIMGLLSLALLVFDGCHSRKKDTAHEPITSLEERTMDSHQAIERIEDAKRKLLPLDDVMRQALIDQALSWDDMYRDVVKLAVVRAIERGYSFKEGVGLVCEDGAVNLQSASDAAMRWLSTIPQEVQSMDDFEVRRKLLVEHLANCLTQQTLDEILVVAATLNGLTVDPDGSIQRLHDQMPLAERDRTIFGKQAISRGAGSKLSREDALTLLADEPLLFLTIFKHKPPDRFLRAFTESLCEAMAKEGLVPDTERGWIKGKKTFSESTGLVFDLMVSGNLEHPIVTGISKVLDDHARADVFIKALYDKCGGYLIRTSGGVEAVVPDR